MGTQILLTLPPDLNMEVEKIQMVEKAHNGGKKVRTKHDQVVRLIEAGIETVNEKKG